MSNIEGNKVLKYYLLLRWPGPCRNRSESTLAERPDLVFKITEFTNKIIEIFKTYKNPIQVDNRYNITGLNTWWSSGADLHHFLRNLKKNDVDIISKIQVINHVDGKIFNFELTIDLNQVTVKEIN